MSKEKWPLAHIKHTCYNHLLRHGFTYMSILSTYIHNKRKKWNFFFVAKNFNFFPFFTPYTSHLANIYTFVIQHKKNFQSSIYTHPHTYTHMQKWSYVCEYYHHSFSYGCDLDGQTTMTVLLFYFIIFFFSSSICILRANHAGLRVCLYYFFK